MLRYWKRWRSWRFWVSWTERVFVAFHSQHYLDELWIRHFGYLNGSYMVQRAAIGTGFMYIYKTAKDACLRLLACSKSTICKESLELCHVNLGECCVHCRYPFMGNMMNGIMGVNLGCHDSFFLVLFLPLSSLVYESWELYLGFWLSLPHRKV